MGHRQDLCKRTVEQASLSKFNLFHFHFFRLQVHHASDTKGGTQSGQIISPVLCLGFFLSLFLDEEELGAKLLRIMVHI